MGFIDFIKGAGEKLFGSDEPSPEDIAEEKAKKVAKAESALEAYVAKQNLDIEFLDIKFSSGDVTIYGETSSAENAEKAAVACGNVKGVSRVNNLISVKQPVAKFHTVESGDTLSKISKAVYGDAMKYNVIFEANKPMLSHPDKIYPGQVLRIPNL